MSEPLSPDERAKLQLAPGSRWEGDQVVDEDDVRATVTLRDRGASWVNIEQYGTDVVAFVPNVLAVIRAAGLDPEYAELVEAEGAVKELFRLCFSRRVKLEELEPLAKAYREIGETWERARFAKGTGPMHVLWSLLDRAAEFAKKASGT